MSTPSKHILGPDGVFAATNTLLHGCQATRALEKQYPDTQTTPPLMQRAGLAIAELALALAPHSRTIWVACGPGNNGGDGILAAQYLQRWGKQTIITGPENAAKAAESLGLTWSAKAPGRCELAIDALFGIGAGIDPARNITGIYGDWISELNQLDVPVLAVDIPSGLHADTGMAKGPWVMADHTLSLLTLKPGLFTGNGRDACGQIWWNTLGIDTTQHPADALLNGAPAIRPRPHNSHKGSYGDVAIVGGANGMEGAAILAATAALYAGAGRVFLTLCGNNGTLPQAMPPEFMARTLSSLPLDQLTVVAGCGAGEQLADHLHTIIARSQQLVLDADALNTLARRPDLQPLVGQRGALRTVLTPHPLEAARLLGTDVHSVQSDRMQAAQVLSRRFNACVLLKGSGSVISAPDQTACINPTGTARLACAGTGDVLAGLTGALMASGLPGFQAGLEATYRHGRVADTWPAQAGTLTAGQLARAVSA